jgi:CreA protein
MDLATVFRRAFAGALASLAALCAGPAHAAEEPDLIFKRSTVFKLLTPNDKLATYGIDDPEVEGVACHFTVPERGGVKGRQARCRRLPRRSPASP